MARLKYDADVAPKPAAWLALDEEEAQWLVRRYHASPRCEHPPAQKPVLHATIHVFVENQVALGNETPVRATLERLMAEGLSRHDAIHAIGFVLARYVYDLMNSTQTEGASGHDRYFDEIRCLTAEAWRRSAAEDAEEMAEWLAQTEDVRDWSTATAEEIVQGLCVPPPHFPREALREAERRKEQIADRLLTLVQDTGRCAREGAIPEGNGHIFAMLLLAEIEDPRAFDVIADLFTLPADLCEEIGGDFVTEDLGRVLASVCGGRIEPLARIIEDRRRWEYVRGAAVSAICVLVQRGHATRDEAVAYLTTLTRERLEREPSAVWGDAANLALDLYADELFDDVRRWIDEELIDPFYMSTEDVNRVEREGLKAALAALERDVHLHPARDIVAATEWWDCYADPEEDDWVPDADDFAPEVDSAPVPLRAIKIGRNDPCPCGSGKKYKKCCLGT
jgi:hypothetical protein